MLCIGTTGSLLQINAKTLDVDRYFDLQDNILSDILNMDTVVINAAGSVYFSLSSIPHQIWCIVGSHFENMVNVLQWKHADIQKNETDIASALAAVSASDKENGDTTGGLHEGDNFEGLTVLSNAPLIDDSVLRSEMVKKVKEEPKGKKNERNNTPQETRSDYARPACYIP